MEYIVYDGKKYYVKDGVLDLSNMTIYDLAIDINELKGFANLTNLRSLNLSNIGLTEIKMLERYTDLEVLNLSSCEILEIKGLENLKKLKELNLSGNQITEIKGLETLTDLQKLYLYGNQITEIKGLQHLRKLKELNLSKNLITEIRGLETLTNLQELNLFKNQITEIKGLEMLTNLLKLELSCNKFTEIKGLENLINLKILFLNENKIPQKLLENLEKQNFTYLAERKPELYKKWTKLEERFKKILKLLRQREIAEDKMSRTSQKKLIEWLLSQIDFDLDYLDKINENFSQIIVKYCRQIRKELDIIEKDTISKLKELIKKSPRVNLKQIKVALKMDTHTFNNKIIDWADEFSFTIDGDYLIVNKDTVSDFIDALDKQFAKWEKGKKNE